MDSGGTPAKARGARCSTGSYLHRLRRRYRHPHRHPYRLFRAILTLPPRNDIRLIPVSGLAPAARVKRRRWSGAPRAGEANVSCLEFDVCGAWPVLAFYTTRDIAAGDHLT